MAQGISELSVILPAYNEGEYIEVTLRQLKAELDKLNIPYEILVVNDGSKDDTAARATRCASGQIRVLSYAHNRGKGYAVGYGMRHASGKYRLFMDVDLSTSLDMVGQFLAILKEGSYDLVIGNRKTKFSEQKIKQPFYRRFFGEGFTWISSLLIGRRTADFTCGFKMYTARAAEIIFTRQKIFDWAFDAELIYIALLHNLRIHEAPVIWQHHSDSRVRVVRDILTSLLSLFKMRINSLRGLYL